jgi:hypothetical protein
MIPRSPCWFTAAFAPDKGESVASLIKNPPPGAPVPPILPPQDGYLFLDKTKFAESFAADVSPDLAEFMADSQVLWGVEALTGAIMCRSHRLSLLSLKRLQRARQEQLDSLQRFEYRGAKTR